MRKANLVFDEEDGDGASVEVPRGKLLIGNFLRLPVMAKIVTTIAVEGEITIELQGYLTAKSDWVVLGSAIITEATTTYIHADSMPKCRKYRLEITENDGVVVATAHIGVGRVED